MVYETFAEAEHSTKKCPRCGYADCTRLRCDHSSKSLKHEAYFHYLCDHCGYMSTTREHEDRYQHKCNRCDFEWDSLLDSLVHCLQCHSGLWADTSGVRYDWEPCKDHYDMIKGKRICVYRDEA